MKVGKVGSVPRSPGKLKKRTGERKEGVAGMWCLDTRLDFLYSDLSSQGKLPEKDPCMTVVHAKSLGE